MPNQFTNVVVSTSHHEPFMASFRRSRTFPSMRFDLEEKHVYYDIDDQKEYLKDEIVQWCQERNYKFAFVSCFESDCRKIYFQNERHGIHFRKQWLTNRLT